MKPKILIGDCLDVLKTFPENHFHACVSDPPSGISFMGKEWDSDRGGRKEWIGWLAERMREVFRVLRPGAFAVVWALPRTSHWTATALEDAGLEVRDCLYHVFGQGFSKSADAAKLIDNHLGVERKVVGTQMPDVGMQGGNMHADRERKVVSAPVTAATSPEAEIWDGWGSALKPAVECWWLARKPLDGTIAENLLKWSCGALNIEAARITTGDPLTRELGKTTISSSGWRSVNRSPVAGKNGGRWPSNFLMSHDGRCTLCGTKKVKAHDGIRNNSIRREQNIYGGGAGIPQVPLEVRHGDENGEEEVEDWDCVPSCPIRIIDSQSGITKAGGQPQRRGDIASRNAYGNYKGGKASPGVGPSEGGASRFFYCGKANAERDPWNKHMTLKPLDLMIYFLQLTCPKGGRVVDSFCGSGSTNLAALRLGLESIGIDIDPQYVRWAEMRVSQTVDGFGG